MNVWGFLIPPPLDSMPLVDDVRKSEKSPTFPSQFAKTHFKIQGWVKTLQVNPYVNWFHIFVKYLRGSWQGVLSSGVSTCSSDIRAYQKSRC